MTNNIFTITKTDIQDSNKEFFETLKESGDVKIERIISTGQTTPPDQWYDQEKAEWVVLLTGEAELTFEDGNIKKLTAGDYLFIPPHQKHRVTYTSIEPACIWLAMHFPYDQT